MSSPSGSSITCPGSVGSPHAHVWLKLAESGLVSLIKHHFVQLCLLVLSLINSEVFTSRNNFHLWFVSFNHHKPSAARTNNGMRDSLVRHELLQTVCEQLIMSTLPSAFLNILVLFIRNSSIVYFPSDEQLVVSIINMWQSSCFLSQFQQSIQLYASIDFWNSCNWQANSLDRMQVVSANRKDSYYCT